MRRRWPMLPVVAGAILIWAASAMAGMRGDSPGEPDQPADTRFVLTGVLLSDTSPIDPASVVLTVEGRTVYTGDFDWHLYPGSTFEIRWVTPDETVAAWEYRPNPDFAPPSTRETRVEMEFRDHRGRVYQTEYPEAPDEVLPAAPGNILEVTGAYVAPNPFNPFHDDTVVRFVLSMDAEVKIQAYDWTGDFVDTVFEGAGNTGLNTVDWGGQTEDGRKLGNGVYLLRIVASTQARSESEVVKAVIWNEE